MMNRLRDDLFSIGSKRISCRIGILGLLLLVSVRSAAANEAGMGETSLLSSPERGNWSEEYGVAVGGGLGMKVFGSDLDHHFVLSKVHYGWDRERFYFDESWFRGQFGVLAEFVAGGQFDPEGAYILGLTPVLRYRFDYWDRLKPFVEGAAGVLLTDVGAPSLGSVFEFYQQAGGGLEWRQTETLSLTVQSRFVHVSNAGITRSNRGINNLFFFLGANWSF